MVLKTRRWGPSGSTGVVCVHGLAQHGGIFAGMAKRLVAAGHSVTSVDLRGHGESGREPPWNVATHVEDLLETIDNLGIESVVWVGHSFGGRLAAEAAARFLERSRRLVLLDPALVVTPAKALQGAEIERLDWSFATIDGAVNALLANEANATAPRDAVAAYVRDDVRKGPDGRFRFRFCPSAVVVAWSEMVLPVPPVAQLPTLLVCAEANQFGALGYVGPYESELGELFTAATVPNGHNVLWESPEETTAAVERFLAEGSASA